MMNERTGFLSEGTERMMAAFQAERAQRAERSRAAFFASGEPVPDLDLWPACPICDIGEMQYDEGWWCTDCGIEWDRAGENGTIDNTDAPLDVHESEG